MYLSFPPNSIITETGLIKEFAPTLPLYVSLPPKSMIMNGFLNEYLPDFIPNSAISPRGVSKIMSSFSFTLRFFNSNPAFSTADETFIAP